LGGVCTKVRFLVVELPGDGSPRSLHERQDRYSRSAAEGGVIWETGVGKECVNESVAPSRYTTEQFPFKDGWGGQPEVANQELIAAR
jgi:hypothetical protein